MILDMIEEDATTSTRVINISRNSSQDIEHDLLYPFHRTRIKIQELNEKDHHVRENFCH